MCLIIEVVVVADAILIELTNPKCGTHLLCVCGWLVGRLVSSGVY